MAVGSVLTVAGLVGIVISFVVQQSDFDPTSFAIATASIFVAIVGISFILQTPKSETKTLREPL
jgi:hypothetical protein